MPPLESESNKHRHLPELIRSANRREVRLFIASPSDCGGERALIRKAINELNEVVCPAFQISLVPIGWENVAPGLGDPQEVIDAAIGEYDILVGVMWLRFGTPTASGEQSGTEHEFNRAYELWKSSGKPNVMFYFNDHPPENMLDLDIEQLQRVRTFRDKLQGMAFVKSYKGLPEFEELIRLDLQRTIRDIGAKTVLPTRISKPIPRATQNKRGPTPPPLFFHSCPLPRHFIRRQEIPNLVNLISHQKQSEESPSVISVVGIAGSGKTVSVRAALDEVIQRKTKIDGVFWYSFYESKAQSAEEFLLEALSYFSGGELDIDAFPSPHQKKVQLWQYLQTGRYIIILDGLEYLQIYAPSSEIHGKLQDRVMRDFLRGACQLTTSLVVVTSRIYLADLYAFRGYESILLGSFQKEEAWAYMRYCGVSGSDQAIDDACSIFGYHPLSLRVLTDYLVRYYKGAATAARHFKKLATGSPLAEKLDALFGSYWKFLNEDQQFFLTRLSALRSGATEKDFSVLVRPKAIGGTGDPQDPSFRESLARLEDSALLEAQERRGEKFYTAPALLRMLAYDRMSSEERRKAHLEWLRYTEGIPVPAIPQDINGLAPVIEVIYHCLRAQLYVRAWELYSRKGKYKLSRRLIDWGSHEIAIEIAREFWALKDSFAGAIEDPIDFENELIGYYSTHLALSGRIAAAQEIISQASVKQFGIPLCIRMRYLLLAGDYKSAVQLYDTSRQFSHNLYSVSWSKALLDFYGHGKQDSLRYFETALENGFMIVRGYLGLLYFDYITALLFFSRFHLAETEIRQMETIVIESGGASGINGYAAFLKAELNRIHKEGMTLAIQQYELALSLAKETGDTFLECATLLGRAKLELALSHKVNKTDHLDSVVDLSNKSLLLSRDAGEGVLDYGFIIHAGEAFAILARCSLIKGDTLSAREYFEKLGLICDKSQNYKLKREHRLLRQELSLS
jgi:hypothetical protein